MPPQFSDFNNIDALLDQLEGSPEASTLREVYEAVRRLMTHVENEGYLAGSDAPEMMHDAWVRLLSDFVRVQMAEKVVSKKIDDLKRTEFKKNEEMLSLIERINTSYLNLGLDVADERDTLKALDNAIKEKGS